MNNFQLWKNNGKNETIAEQKNGKRLWLLICFM